MTTIKQFVDNNYAKINDEGNGWYSASFNLLDVTSLNDEHKRYEYKRYNFCDLYGAKPENFYKGKDNNMTNVKVYVDCVGATKYGTEKSFFVAGPKFDTGAKIKFWNGLDIKAGVINWKQGVIYSINKKVTVSKTGDEKEFKADNLQWFYTIIENGNLKTWNGIKEEFIKIDDTPDYTKYFDLMSRSGIDFKKEQYTIVTWDTCPTSDYGMIDGYDNRVVLKSKYNNHETVIKFWVNSANKPPSISQEC